MTTPHIVITPRLEPPAAKYLGQRELSFAMLYSCLIPSWWLDEYTANILEDPVLCQFRLSSRWAWPTSNAGILTIPHLVKISPRPVCPDGRTQDIIVVFVGTTVGVVPGFGGEQYIRAMGSSPGLSHLQFLPVALLHFDWILSSSQAWHIHIL